MCTSIATFASLCVHQYSFTLLPPPQTHRPLIHSFILPLLPATSHHSLIIGKLLLFLNQNCSFPSSAGSTIEMAKRWSIWSCRCHSVALPTISSPSFSSSSFWPSPMFLQLPPIFPHFPSDINLISLNNDLIRPIWFWSIRPQLIHWTIIPDIFCRCLRLRKSYSHSGALCSCQMMPKWSGWRHKMVCLIT